MNQHFTQNVVGRLLCARQVLMRTGVALLFVMAINQVLHAQSTTISGSIKDENGLALPGVNVIEKGTTNGTTSDADGKFQISVSPTSVLVFSFIGYKIREVIVDGQTVVDIALAPDVTSLEEVVVTGYYSQKKSDLTGAVGVVEDAKKTATYDVAKMLQGQVAGVTVRHPFKDKAYCSIPAIFGLG